MEVRVEGWWHKRGHGGELVTPRAPPRRLRDALHRLFIELTQAELIEDIGGLIL